MADALSVVRLAAGVVVQVDPPQVNVAGRVVPAWFAGTYIPGVGDPVRVLTVDGAAIVLGPVTTTQRSVTGTVAGAASAGLVPVTTSAGTVQARYVGTAPSVGTVVRLDWQSTTPWVWTGAVALLTGEAPADPSAPTAPPVIEAGTLPVPASDSGRWSTAYGWSYPAYPTRLQQGVSGGTNTGAWFFGSAPAAIAGRTVTGLRIWVQRSTIHGVIGLSTVHLWLHTSRTRPAGNVTRTLGPTDVSLARGQGAWVTLPAAWGQTIVDSGGGIAIHGDPYLLVDGVADTPTSGQLQIDWRR